MSTHFCSLHDWQDDLPCPYHGGLFLEGAEALRLARIRYAESFLRHRVRAASDGQAHQRAIAETKDELTTLEAQLYLARRELDRQ